MNRLIVIDGNAIIHRAYHALPPLTTKDGLMVNAVYGFTSMLLKVWKDLKPTHLAVTFDVAGGTFRHTKYKEYKATRVKADQELYDQIPLVHEVVRAFGFPIYEKQGFEADDVIGTIVEKNKEQGTKSNGLEIFVVTGDMDTLQLVGPGVKIYTLRKGMSDIVIYDEAEVKKRFGFGPELVVDYKALRGDASDNIPGVPGIGEKTASELILKFGSIEKIYSQLTTNKEKLAKEIKPGVLKKLEEGEKSARMSFELAQIENQVPGLDFSLSDCAVKEIDREKIATLFQKFEFTSLLKRLPGAVSDAKPAKTAKKTKAEPFNFSEIKNSQELSSVIKSVETEKQFACKAVLDGQDIFNSQLVGFSLVVKEKGFWLPAKEATQEFFSIFSNSEIEVVGHDLKQLVKVLSVFCHSRESGNPLLKVADPRFRGDDSVVGCRLFDTMLASYLLNPGSRAHDPASIVLKILGKELPAGSGQESLFGVDKRAITQELWLLSQAAEKLKIELKKTDDLGLYEKVEAPLVAVLAEVELNGVAVDLEMLKKLSVEGAAQIKKTEKKIFDLSGEEFNVASPIQLRDVLFDKLQLPTMGVKKGKTGLSTNAEELEKLRGLHPIIAEIENFRELSKLQNTYIDVLPTLINKKTGRIHTTFNQAVTATGRLSSSDPNLQNIPIRTELGREVRKAFVSEPGNLLVSADYSQIELRIVASLAQDKRMMEIFEKGEDIHRATAAAINNVKLEDVTKEMRRAAKEINFGILYGMGAYGLAWRAEIPQWQAKEFIAKYFEQFAGVKKYIDQTLEFTKKEGYCETLFGRRRYIPELNSPNYQLRAGAERMAINHPVQGTAADLIKMAMISVNEKIKNQNVKMILQVHDELVFEVKKDLAQEAGEIIRQTMENVVKLRVPVKVDVNIGHSWGEMK